MLQLLHIENIAVIEKTEVEFCGGLNVLTGETGAGKSIVIDALGAVLGSRVSRELVRTGAESAMVTAVFTDEGGEAWCRENGIDCEDGQLLLLRRLAADGKSGCRINGCPVTASQLRELGARLLDIHGQNDGQRLLDEKYHLSYLDSFGGLSAAVSSCHQAYSAYREVRKEIDELSLDEGEKARRVDALTYQIEEIERAGIKPGELSELTERRDFLKNSGKLTEAVNEAYRALYGGERTDGAVSLIEEAEASMTAAVRYSDKLSETASALSDLKYTAEDIAAQLRELKDSLDFSPEEYDQLENRLDQLKRLIRKYGPAEEDVLAFLEKAKADLADIEYSTEKLEKLNIEMNKRLKAAEAEAEKLSEKRKTAALALEKRVKAELSQLSMPGVRFEVGFKRLPAPTANGWDEVAFLMSANAGEAIGHISKIASGGELARIMLAMKNVLAEGDNIGTMVFDEVDTGVSGIAAQRVGEKLAALSAKRQVICVTHLPQIAVMADAHFSIVKSQRSDRTYTEVLPLNEDGRKREIARLTGGENITETTLTAAAEQLEAAKRFKNR